MDTVADSRKSRAHVQEVVTGEVGKELPHPAVLSTSLRPCRWAGCRI